jgi:hypothetical protein
MWVRYASFVSFVALLLAFSATLMAGWSYAEAIPRFSTEQQRPILIYSIAIALIAWPVWAVHWRMVLQDWLWESKNAQNYLIFFTAAGLGASVIIGIQLLARVLGILTDPGHNGTWESNRAFLIGASWSVAWSLGLWTYHHRTWINLRRGRKQSGESSAPSR